MRFIETSDGKTRPITALSKIYRACEVVEGGPPQFSLIAEIGEQEYLLWEGSSPGGLEDVAARILAALGDERRRIVRLRTREAA